MDSFIQTGRKIFWACNFQDTNFMFKQNLNHLGCGLYTFCLELGEKILFDAPSLIKIYYFIFKVQCYFFSLDIFLISIQFKIQFTMI